ncbi:MAG: efflux RND transporter periplasmic adaptor subunit [Gammaproteobacteria bacterium]|nr:efflux RND transporter periplasmic adaptor subunit [Gammaproteobacteria bacterium]
MGSRFMLIAAAMLILLIRLPAAAGEDAIPVIVTEARLAPFEDRVEALGTLLAFESVTVSSTVTETVAAIHFDDGDRVPAGQVLVELNDREERALLEEARVLSAEAQRQYERLKTLQAQGQAALSLVDERQREWEAGQARVRSLEARLSDRTLRAPFAGVLGLRNISVGALVEPGDIITTLDDDRVMKLEFTVPATFLEALRPGLRIVARAPALSGRTFEGEVAVIDSRVDPVTRSIRIRAHLPNPDRVLRPGLLMEVALSKNPRRSVRLPEETLLQLGERHYVLVVTGNRAERREIRIGARRPGEVEIREGVEAGDQIIVHGTTRARDGDPVRVVAVDDGTIPLAELLRSLGQ